jgi:hypothetical protein
VVLLGIIALSVGLVWYMPVRVVVHHANLPLGGAVLSGRALAGAADLPQGYRAEWRINAGRSLLAFSPTFDVTAIGPGADLRGRVSLLPGRYALSALSGTVGWPMVTRLMPGLAIACDLTANLDDLAVRQRGAVRNASGGLRTGPGSCARLDGSVTGVPVPALIATLSGAEGGVQGVLAAQSAPDSPLATATLTDQDRLILRVHAAGARLVPGMPATSDSEIELPLSAVLP